MVTCTIERRGPRMRNATLTQLPENPTLQEIVDWWPENYHWPIAGTRCKCDWPKYKIIRAVIEFVQPSILSKHFGGVKWEAEPDNDTDQPWYDQRVVMKLRCTQCDTAETGDLVGFLKVGQEIPVAPADLEYICTGCKLRTPGIAFGSIGHGTDGDAVYHRTCRPCYDRINGVAV